MKKINTFHVSHILVQHEYEALDLLRKIQEGKDFEELARVFSKCSSASRGGDLGPIPLGAADENFEEAAVILNAGEMTSKPVRSRFGYHLILRK